MKKMIVGLLISCTLNSLAFAAPLGAFKAVMNDGRVGAIVKTEETLGYQLDSINAGDKDLGPAKWSFKLKFVKKMKDQSTGQMKEVKKKVKIEVTGNRYETVSVMGEE